MQFYHSRSLASLALFWNNSISWSLSLILLLKNILFFSHQTCPHFLQYSPGQVLRMFLLGTEKEAVKRSLPLNRQPAGVEILSFRQRERDGRRPQGESGSPWKSEHDGKAAFLAHMHERIREGGWAWVSDFLTTASPFYNSITSSFLHSFLSQLLHRSTPDWSDLLKMAWSLKRVSPPMPTFTAPVIPTTYPVVDPISLGLLAGSDRRKMGRRMRLCQRLLNQHLIRPVVSFCLWSFPFFYTPCPLNQSGLANQGYLITCVSVRTAHVCLASCCPTLFSVKRIKKFPEKLVRNTTGLMTGRLVVSDRRKEGQDGEAPEPVSS